MLPETRYARRGDIHIAYEVLGEGEIDLVFVSEWFVHLEGRWGVPSYARFLRRLSSFSRLIDFDKYGIGLSDPAPPGSLPPLEEWMDDVRAVMDAAGSERAAILGAGEGGIMAAMFAATYPDRTSCSSWGTRRRGFRGRPITRSGFKPSSRRWSSRSWRRPGGRRSSRL